MVSMRLLQRCEALGVIPFSPSHLRVSSTCSGNVHGNAKDCPARTSKFPVILECVGVSRGCLFVGFAACLRAEGAGF